MPPAPHNEVRPGALVSIILRANQPTSGLVQGTVAEVLAKQDHTRSVEVLLTDGRIGLVQEVLHDGTGPQHYFTQRPPRNPAIPNPQNWQAHTSSPGGHPSSHSHHPMTLSPPEPQHWQAHTNHTSGRPPSRTGHSPGPEPPNWQADTHYPSGRPPPRTEQSPAPDTQNWQAHTNHPGGRPHSRTGHSPVPEPQNWPAQPSNPPSGRPSPRIGHSPVPDPQNWQTHTSFPNGHSPTYAQPQWQHPHRPHSQTPQPHLLTDDSPHIPPAERSEQMEYLQSYEESHPVSEDDRNQATLQKEFPNIDSSLIAAIYNDSKSLSATREMLEELKD